MDLHEEIIGPDGRNVKLCDVLGVNASVGGNKEAPRLSAKFWEEYSGKQTLLSTFFGKGKKEKEEEPVFVATPIDVDDDSMPCLQAGTAVKEDQDMLDGTPELELSIPDSFPPPSSQVTHVTTPSSPTPMPTLIPKSEAMFTTETQSAPPPKKRKISPEDESSVPKGKKSKAKVKPKAGQAKLSSFFAQPSSGSSTKFIDDKAKELKEGSSSASLLSGDHDQDQLDSDYRLALSLSASQENVLSQAIPISSKSNGKGKQTTTAWSDLLAPLQPPKCAIHNERAKELTVTKPGPNKGKNFFICSRPVGPGYDRGKSERLREEVDHQWRCNFFKWSSEVKRENMKGKTIGEGEDGVGHPPASSG